MRCTSYLIICFNDTATTEIYTLSLHDALPICDMSTAPGANRFTAAPAEQLSARGWIVPEQDGSHTYFAPDVTARSEEHTSELQSRQYLVCRLLLEKKKINPNKTRTVHHSMLPQ